jgi:hypothetical protein
MKKVSSPLSVLWHADPNKDLWSLMAKAWSIMRDQVGKDKAPLNAFLSLVCEGYGLPSPETYLEDMGWFLFIEDDTPKVCRDDLAHDVRGAVPQALSVKDIIKFVQCRGYCSEQTFQETPTSSTFLRHSSGRAEDARLAERNKRRAQRQAKQNDAFAQELRKKIRYAHSLRKDDNRPFTPPKELLFGPQFGPSPFDYNFDSFNNVHNALGVPPVQRPDPLVQHDDPPVQHDDGGDEHISNTDYVDEHSGTTNFDISEWEDAFLPIADSDVTMPNAWNRN